MIPLSPDAPASRQFSNRACEFYPCHGFDPMNCLFCYCPLYRLDCGGEWALTAGVKDCSECIRVHDGNGWEYVQEKLKRT